MSESAISPEELEWIGRYCNHQLRGEELALFEARLVSDKNWKKSVEELRFLALGIQEANLQDAMQDFHATVPDAALRLVRLSIGVKWMAAASVILVIMIAVAVSLLGRDHYDRLYVSYFETDPGLPIPMSEGRQKDYNFYDGMIYYKEQQYKIAIEKWKEQGTRYGFTDTINYYIGAAYLNAGAYNKANAYLGKVQAVTGSSFYGRAVWSLALIQLKKKDEVRARTLLKTLKGDPLAQRLLEELK